MRFTKRISLFLWQATKLPTRSLLRNPSLCRSYIVGSPISSGDVVTGLSYGQIRRRFIGYTAEQFSDDEYECEFEEHKVRVFRLIMKGSSFLDILVQTVMIVLFLVQIKMGTLSVC